MNNKRKNTSIEKPFLLREFPFPHLRINYGWWCKNLIQIEPMPKGANSIHCLNVNEDKQDKDNE